MRKKLERKQEDLNNGKNSIFYSALNVSFQFTRLEMTGHSVQMTITRPIQAIVRNFSKNKSTITNKECKKYNFCSEYLTQSISCELRCRWGYLTYIWPPWKSINKQQCIVVAQGGTRVIRVYMLLGFIRNWPQNPLVRLRMMLVLGVLALLDSSNNVQIHFWSQHVFRANDIILSSPSWPGCKSWRETRIRSWRHSKRSGATTENSLG